MNQTTLPTPARISLPDDCRTWPAVFAHRVLGVTPHETQARFLNDRAAIKVAACGRRWGKSVSAALDTIHLAVTGDADGHPTQQMVVAPTSDQTSIICGEIERTLRDSPLAPLVRTLVHSPFFELTLANGSTILARSAGDNGKNLRGRGLHRVIVDEAAYVPERVIQEAIIPMLADTDGQLVLISTPFGRNVFWEFFMRGQTHTRRTSSYQFPSTLNPHISATYIADQRDNMTDLQFRAEWLAEFLDDQSTVFKWSLIERATRGELAEPLYAHRYVIGWDPAKYHDRSAVVVLDVTNDTWPVVSCTSVEGRDYGLQIRHVAEMARRYHDAFVLMDATSNDALLEQLRTAHDDCDGLLFTNAAKQEIIDGVVLALERDHLTFPPVPALISEMRYYEYVLTPAGNVKLGAPDRANAYDDHVTALALAVHAAHKGRHLGYLDADVQDALAAYAGL